MRGFAKALGPGLILASIAIFIYILYAGIQSPATLFVPTIIFLLGVTFLLAPFLPPEEQEDGIAQAARFIVAGASGGFAAEVTVDEYSISVTLFLILGLFVLLLSFEIGLRWFFHTVPIEKE